jgi:hypothetical protein
VDINLFIVLQFRALSAATAFDLIFEDGDHLLDAIRVLGC